MELGRGSYLLLDLACDILATVNETARLSAKLDCYNEPISALLIFKQSSINHMSNIDKRREKIKRLQSLALKDKNTPKVFQADYLLRQLTRNEFQKQNT